MNAPQGKKAALPDWDSLSFRFTQTDEIFECFGDIDRRPVWDDGRFGPFEDVSISPAATVFSYGLSVFEGLKAERSQDGRILLFRAEQNARRFKQSAQLLKMPPFDEKRFVVAVEELVRRNARFVPPAGKGTLYVRPTLFADESQLGLRTSRRYRVIMYACPVGGYFSAQDAGLKLRVLKQGRVAPGGSGAAKAAGNYAASLNRREEWKNDGYDDVLFLDARAGRFVTETTGSNVFAAMKDGSVVTPPLDDQILPGVTRDSAIRICREALKIPVFERPLSIEEIASDAREVFCTGTAWTVRGVRELIQDDSSVILGEPAVGSRILNALRGIQSGQKPDPYGWVKAVA